MFRIPKEQLTGFRRLIELSEDQRKRLVEYMGQIDIGEDIGPLEEVEKITGIETSTLDSIFLTVAGLLGTWAATSDTDETFTTELIEAFSDQTQDTSLDTQGLSSFFVALLRSSQGYATTIKANVLSQERERLASMFRVITDIRPIFDSHDGQSLLGYVIMQNLIVDYSQDGKTKKAVFAIDDVDLGILKNQIERAIEKRNSIGESLKLTKLKEIKLD